MFVERVRRASHLRKSFGFAKRIGRTSGRRQSTAGAQYKKGAQRSMLKRPANHRGRRSGMPVERVRRASLLRKSFGFAKRLGRTSGMRQPTAGAEYKKGAQRSMLKRPAN